MEVDVRPLILTIAEAKKVYGVGYAPIRQMREDAEKALSKNSRGREFLKALELHHHCELLRKFVEGVRASKSQGDILADIVNAEPRSQAEIGRRYGISRERVRQIRETLKAHAEATGLPVEKIVKMSQTAFAKLCKPPKY